MQEVDVHTARSGKLVDEAEEIAKRTGMKAWFSKAIDLSGGEYGIAILSRLPLDSVITYKLPSAKSGDPEPRVLALAYLKIGKGRHFAFACTHMDASSNDSSRLMQMEEILHIQKRVRCPLLIAGDFNADPGGKVLGLFDSVFTRSCLAACPNTIPSDKPTNTIEHIGYRKEDRFSVLSHRVINEPYPSDHLPVVADLLLSFEEKE